MPDFPRGNYRDWGDEGSERSSFTDEAGYQSSNADRRSTSGSVASNDDRNNQPRETLTTVDTGRERNLNRGDGASTELTTSRANLSSLRSDGLDSSSHATGRRFQAGRSVDFARDEWQSQDPQNSAGIPSYFLPMAEPKGDRDSMGPPLSRSLLMQNSGEGSVKSFGSDDGLYLSHDNPRASPFHGSTASSSSQAHDTAADHVIEAPFGRLKRDTAQPPADNLDETSQTGLETDDCECSLDVETHSVHSMGTRSIYSQGDDASLLPRVETASIHDVPAFDARRLVGVNDQLDRIPQGAYEIEQQDSEYQAPVLHLPMKGYEESETEGGQLSSRTNPRREQQSPRWGREDQYRHRSVQRRSRSRSRSPDSDSESERKPAT